MKTKIQIEDQCIQIKALDCLYEEVYENIFSSLDALKYLQKIGTSKNTCYTPNRYVKGKPFERMGHKAIGPYSGKIVRTGSQLPSETSEPILCAKHRG